MRGKELRHWVHDRNLVVREGRKVVLRVVELDSVAVQNRKISREHLWSEDAGLLQGLSGMSTYTFIIHKKEELVADNWAAEGPTENGLRVLCNRAIRQPVGP